jgi:FKBP-type peptidyl-prolyl cis-trans isomerase FklB
MKNRMPPQGARITTLAGMSGCVGLILLVLLTGCDTPPVTGEAGDEVSSEIALDDDAKRASYGIGFNVAGNVSKQFGTFLDDAAFLEGVRDGVAGNSRRVADEEMSAAMNAMQSVSEANTSEVANANLEAGRVFLEVNAKRAEVVSLTSGLQYEVLVEGSGAIPIATDTVTTHYHGTLPDGTVFDSSVERGQPASFSVSGVIPGWVEALQLMPVGSKWRLFVPSELAYRERGAGASIGPNQVLIFDVELLAIGGS